MLRIASLCVLLLFAACDKGPGKPPPLPQPQPQVPQAPTVKAAPGVPQSLADKVAREWPGIQKDGDAFVVKFNEASAARAAGDRDKMDIAIEAARKHFNDALEGWNGIYYTVDDMSEDQGETCRKFLRKWNKQVDSWTKKAKGLKEFSRVK